MTNRKVHEPVLVTKRGRDVGRDVAVLQSVDDYERAEEEREFIRAVVAGLTDLEAGREVDSDEVKRLLGLE